MIPEYKLFTFQILNYIQKDKTLTKHVTMLITIRHLSGYPAKNTPS